MASAACPKESEIITVLCKLPAPPFLLFLLYTCLYPDTSEWFKNICGPQMNNVYRRMYTTALSTETQIGVDSGNIIRKNMVQNHFQTGQ